MRHKMILSFITLLILVIGITSLPIAQAQQGTWYAQYFNNRWLIDPATITRQVSSVSADWGGGSPAEGINADAFSVRWTRTYTLGSGMYQINVRADDGVRVFINNVAYVDDFAPGSGRQHTVNFTLMSGEYVFEVEFSENTGNASISFDFGAFVPPTAPPTQTPPPGVVPSAATAAPTLSFTDASLVVTTGRLNVRSLPSTNARILTSIERFERYPIIGRSVSGDWYQIVVDNLRVVGIVVGWVSAEFVRVEQAENVPVTYGFEGEPVLTNYFLRTRDNVYLRTAPSTDSLVIGILYGNVRLQIAGITADGAWWLVYLEDFLGWIHRDWVTLEQEVDYAQIPVVDPFVVDNPFDDQ
jgi:uncharacterized protein YgiM (DUF1202 family)